MRDFKELLFLDLFAFLYNEAYAVSLVQNCRFIQISKQKDEKKIKS